MPSTKLPTVAGYSRDQNGTIRCPQNPTSYVCAARNGTADTDDDGKCTGCELNTADLFQGFVAVTVAAYIYSRQEQEQELVYTRNTAT